MFDTLEVSTSVQSGRDAEHRNTIPSWLWRRLALAGVMLISIFMNFYQLGQNGFGNLYYAAAIRSMLDSWHNFHGVSGYDSLTPLLELYGHQRPLYELLWRIPYKR